LLQQQARPKPPPRRRPSEEEVVEELMEVSRNHAGENTMMEYTLAKNKKKFDKSLNMSKYKRVFF
jgi:hypothetical protein